MNTALSVARPARWRAAAPVLFLLLGVVYASWASRIPAIRDLLHLRAAQFGLVLLSGGIGAVISFPLAAWLVLRFGGRRAAAYAGVLLLLALPCAALAPSLAALALAVGAMGMFTSCYDVAINVQAAEEEKNGGLSRMSTLHAWFCVGSFSGALLGSAMAALGWSPLLHFVMTALLLAVLLRWSFLALPAAAPAPQGAGSRRFALPRGDLLALGMIAFCGAISEGSIATWSGIYMKDRLLASDGVAPLGYAAFSAMMLVSRLLGDRLKRHHGARRMLVASSLTAACGLAIAVLAPVAVLAVAGFALAGLGVALVFPFIFSAAGRHGAAALTAVATMGYGGNLIGPPIVGFIADGIGMQAALGFVGALSVAVALAASRAKWLV
jgi:MFS family permease